MSWLDPCGAALEGHVLAEVVIEAPVGKYTVEEICEIMAENPSWCPDIPLAAAGYHGAYYFKD